MTEKLEPFPEIVSANGTTLRTEASSLSDSKGMLAYGDTVTIIGKRLGFYKIRTGGNEIGYIPESKVETPEQYAYHEDRLDLPPLDSAMGIPWGASKEDAKKTIVQRLGCTLDSTHTSLDELLFDGGEVGDAERLDGGGLSFSSNGLYRLSAIFTAKENEIPDGSALDKYEEIKELVSIKYGTPAEDVYKFNPSLEYNMYERELAIKSGQAEVYCFWLFKHKNNIYLSVGKDLTVGIVYQNAKMSKKVEKKAADSSGF